VYVRGAETGVGVFLGGVACGFGAGAFGFG
jgi:hypothetical protein